MTTNLKRHYIIFSSNIMPRIEKVLVNSYDRTLLSPSSTCFTVTLPKTFNNVKSVKLEAYAIANTSYNVNTTNQNFIFLEKTTKSVSPNSYSTLLSIPAMVYTSASLATALQSLLNSSNHFGTTYTVTYNSATYFFTFSTTSSTETFELSFNTYYPANRVLGFSNNYVSPSYTTSITSTQAIRLDESIALLECVLGNTISASSPGVTFSYLLEMPELGATQVYYMVTSYYHLMPLNQTLMELTLRLKHPTNNLTFDLNGSDIQFLFSIEMD